MPELKKNSHGPLKYTSDKGNVKHRYKIRYIREASINDVITFWRPPPQLPILFPQKDTRLNMFLKAEKKNYFCLWAKH